MITTRTANTTGEEKKEKKRRESMIIVLRTEIAKKWNQGTVKCDASSMNSFVNDKVITGASPMITTPGIEVDKMIMSCLFVPVGGGAT